MSNGSQMSPRLKVIFSGKKGDYIMRIDLTDLDVPLLSWHSAESRTVPQSSIRRMDTVGRLGNVKTIAELL